MLLLFIFFMKHDKYVLIDVFLQGLMFFVSIMGVIEEMVIKDDTALDLIVRVS